MIRRFKTVCPTMYDPALYTKSGNGYIAAMYKGGSTSICNKTPRINRSRIDFEAPVTLYLRDPVDRFVSGWRYFSWDNPDFKTGPQQVSVQEWLDWTWVNQNPHWATIEECHFIRDNWTILPLSAWPNPKRENVAKNPAPPITDEERAAIEERYARDIEIFRACQT